ncbi:hypothetical protein RB6062 [Rhodopirellula baltica SH 1]|uniref:Uncharacterized protein n=1 Tax=Rhodopirellula baltica (strain DSM 10527 / NCIMB 13988 / SH1) TaxID=243090 RepID=Q7UQV6_RHOBA|nr:hypothetical protein RB6062 [Rhodopirellula baltica SH 1]
MDGDETGLEPEVMMRSHRGERGDRSNQWAQILRPEGLSHHLTFARSEGPFTGRIRPQ